MKVRQPPPVGPEEGRYDPRLGASAYAPLAATFGSLAVAAIGGLFGTAHVNSPNHLAFATGLLVVGVIGSIIGSFCLAGIGAERDPTANLAASIMFVAVSVAVSIESVLGAFEVLAETYVPESSVLFVFACAIGAAFGVVITTFVLADAPSLAPTTMSPRELSEWRSRQWIKSRAVAYKWTNRIAIPAVAVVVFSLILRIAGTKMPISGAIVNSVIGLALVLCLARGILGLNRTKHPASGNDQVSIRAWEALVAVGAVAGYSSILIVSLP